MQAFQKAPLLWALIFAIDLFCLFGLVRARALTTWFVQDCTKKKDWLNSYRLFMASWGTGNSEAIVWSYRAIFGISAAFITFFLFAAH
jgi:hypothetical protein